MEIPLLIINCWFNVWISSELINIINLITKNLVKRNFIIIISDYPMGAAFNFCNE